MAPRGMRILVIANTVGISSVWGGELRLYGGFYALYCRFQVEIGIEIDGRDYGTIPCRIEVSSIASIAIQPAPGSYLSAGDETSGVILKDTQIRADVCDKDYFSPWYPSHIVKEGEPCLVVNGHVQNLDKEKFEISISAAGYDETGEIVAWTLDTAHIAGQIGLRLKYREIGDFTLHLNLSENIIWKINLLYPFCPAAESRKLKISSL